MAVLGNAVVVARCVDPFPVPYSSSLVALLGDSEGVTEGDAGVVPAPSFPPEPSPYDAASVDADCADAVIGPPELETTALVGLDPGADEFPRPVTFNAADTEAPYMAGVLTNEYAANGGW